MIIIIILSYMFRRKIPLAAWSNVWVRDQKLAGILDPNPAGVVDVCA